MSTEPFNLSQDSFPDHLFSENNDFELIPEPTAPFGDYELDEPPASYAPFLDDVRFCLPSSPFFLSEILITLVSI